MLNLILILVAIFFTLIFFLVKTFASTKTQRNPPPSPPTFPIVGNLHQLDGRPHRALHSLSRRHGPVMLVYFGSLPVVIVSSADAARDVMRTHDAVFSSRPRLNPAHKLMYNSTSVSTSPYGEYWRQVRSICVFHLLSPKRVASYRPIREQETTLLLEAVKRHSSLSLTVDLSESLSSLTEDIICRATFGKKYGRDEKKKLKEMIKEFTGLLGGFSVGDYIPWLSWVNRISGFNAKVDRVAMALDEFLEGIVREHIGRDSDKSDDEKDFVDVLLEFHGAKKKDGINLDRDSVKALIIDMYLGTDTIYTALEWAMAELLKHPKILKKLQAEVDEVAAGKPKISETDLDKMPYLRAVIKEAFRLHPPSPLTIPHEPMQDCQIQGFDVAERTRVIVNVWAIGRDPNSWEHPEEFDPERFLKFPAIDLKGNDSFELIPFGAGRRICPGATFAIIVVEYVLANLVHTFDWALPDGRVEELDMNECVGFTARRRDPLLAIAKPRFD